MGTAGTHSPESSTNVPQVPPPPEPPRPHPLVEGAAEVAEGVFGSDITDPDGWADYAHRQFDGLIAAIILVAVFGAFFGGIYVGSLL